MHKVEHTFKEEPMTGSKFEKEVLPQVLELVKESEPSAETERSSPIINKEAKIANEKFQILTQNTKKDSKFARCALKGHQVVWAIDEMGYWRLIVDGKLVEKSQVGPDGTLL